MRGLTPSLFLCAEGTDVRCPGELAGMCRVLDKRLGPSSPNLTLYANFFRQKVTPPPIPALPKLTSSGRPRPSHPSATPIGTRFTDKLWPSPRAHQSITIWRGMRTKSDTNGNFPISRTFVLKIDNLTCSPLLKLERGSSLDNIIKICYNIKKRYF